MCQVAVNIPEAVLYDTHMSREEASKFARRAVALGYCAQIAEMTEEDFIRYLGENQISIFRFDDKKEFLEELENA